jgi:hypothetical protein
VRPVKYHRSLPLHGSLLLLGLLVVSNSESPPLEIRGFSFESPIFSLSKTIWR